MKVRTISTRSVADALHRASCLVVLGVLLASPPPATAQQYPPPAYPGPAQPPTYPGPGQSPSYPGPGYGGPTAPPPPLQQEVVPPPPGPRWCGHRDIGAGRAVGCGRRAAMSPVPILMPFGFPVSGAHDTAPGCGSRDIGGVRLRTARTSRGLHGHRARSRADVQHRHTPARARATGSAFASRSTWSRRPPPRFPETTAGGSSITRNRRRDPRDRPLRAYRFVRGLRRTDLCRVLCRSPGRAGARLGREARRVFGCGRRRRDAGANPARLNRRRSLPIAQALGGFRRHREPAAICTPCCTANKAAASEPGRRASGGSPRLSRAIIDLRETPSIDAAAERVKRADPGEKIEIVRDQLAEPDPRIDDDPLARDSGRRTSRDPRLEILEHLDERRIIDRLALHRQGFAAHVHQHHRRLAAGDEGEAVWDHGSVPRHR